MGAAELIESHRDEIVDLCRRFAVRRLRIFGSALTDRWDESRSDLDFLVEYGPEYKNLRPIDRLAGLKVAMEELFGRDVDVVNVAAVRNAGFLAHAEAHTQELYAA
jgi:predicted nucleotidyltransferase